MTWERVFRASVLMYLLLNLSRFKLDSELLLDLSFEKAVWRSVYFVYIALPIQQKLTPPVLLFYYL